MALTPTRAPRVDLQTSTKPASAMTMSFGRYAPTSKSKILQTANYFKISFWNDFRKFLLRELAVYESLFSTEFSWEIDRGDHTCYLELVLQIALYPKLNYFLLSACSGILDFGFKFQFRTDFQHGKSLFHVIINVVHYNFRICI